MSSLVLSATGRAEVSAEHRSMKHHPDAHFALLVFLTKNLDGK